MLTQSRLIILLLLELHVDGSGIRLDEGSGLISSIKLVVPSLVRPTGVQLLDFCLDGVLYSSCFISVMNLDDMFAVWMHL